MPALLSSLAHQSFYLLSPRVQKCWVVPELSSGVKQLFWKENPVNKVQSVLASFAGYKHAKLSQQSLIPQMSMSPSVSCF